MTILWSRLWWCHYIASYSAAKQWCASITVFRLEEQCGQRNNWAKDGSLIFWVEDSAFGRVRKWPCGGTEKRVAYYQA